MKVVAEQESSVDRESGCAVRQESKTERLSNPEQREAVNFELNLRMVTLGKWLREAREKDCRRRDSEQPKLFLIRKHISHPLEERSLSELQEGVRQRSKRQDFGGKIRSRGKR